MDPLDKCTLTLRIAIKESSQNAIFRCEQTVDEYLRSFPDVHSKAGAIGVLENILKADWRTASGPQLQFVNTIFDYLEKRRRELQ
jgi:hypothetical protein